MIYEYFGLPASGKSWHLGGSGFRKERNAISHYVPQGKSSDKLSNTFFGIIRNKILFFILISSGMINFFKKESIVSFRPFLVVFERLGRIITIRKNIPNKEVHIDEGAVQFVWRVFSEYENSTVNQFLLKLSINRVLCQKDVLVYITCSKKKNIEQIVKRKRLSSNFDKAVINKNFYLYKKGRFWMAQVIKNLRKHDVDLVYLSN